LTENGIYDFGLCWMYAGLYVLRDQIAQGANSRMTRRSLYRLFAAAPVAAPMIQRVAPTVQWTAHPIQIQRIASGRITANMLAKHVINGYASSGSVTINHLTGVVTYK
jgi:hypothetical protein